MVIYKENHATVISLPSCRKTIKLLGLIGRHLGQRQRAYFETNQEDLIVLEVTRLIRDWLYGEINIYS